MKNLNKTSSTCDSEMKMLIVFFITAKIILMYYKNYVINFQSII